MRGRWWSNRVNGTTSQDTTMTNSEILRALMDRVWSGGEVAAVDE